GMLGAAVLIVCGSHCAHAQEVVARGVIKLPSDVRQVISIDAHNVLLAETADPDEPTESEYAALVVRHVYSGGIARILGGTVIPTEIFVSPAFNKGGFGGGNPSGITAVGGGFSGGFNNGGGFNSGLNGGGINPIFNSLDRAPQQAQVGQ
ncbi:MAG TPA: hypothetical protein VNA16_10595, partial [Abditibacteriaceae bacterium]|nr:hypothetical protein [Abditibacteriaceae bacterium]